MNTKELPGGFTDAIHHSQQWFRVLLEAMSRPGTIQLPTADACTLSPIPPLSATSAALALTLLDNGTSVWLQEPEHSMVCWLRFHCGCPVEATIGEAAFLFVTDGKQLPDLACAAVGTMEYPDRSAMVVIQVTSFDGPPWIMLSGPGIQESFQVAAKGVDNDLWDILEQNSQGFPLGFDTVLSAPEGVVCIPRSATIRRCT